MSGQLRVALAGGGTAGHVNPLLATAHVLRDRDNRVLAMGTEEGLESTLVPKAGFDLKCLPKVPVPRRPTVDLFSFPRRLKNAIDTAEQILENVDILVGFGGYVAAPAYIAANRMELPFVVQEQNVRAGWANKLGARKAAAVSLTFPNTNLKAQNGVTEVTGMPLRRTFVDVAHRRSTREGRWQMRKKAAQLFGLDPFRPTLLVTGGSLGAKHLNEVTISSAPHIPQSVQIIHVTGKGKSDQVIRVASHENVKFKWKIVEYLTDMEHAMAAADLVLCRSGAVTVSELGTLGLPAFYVPLSVGNGEQKLNAAAQVKAGGALLVEDKHFTSSCFENTVIPLLFEDKRLNTMGEIMRRTSPGDGANHLADLIEGLL